MQKKTYTPVLFISILILGALWIFFSRTNPGETTAEVIPVAQKGFQAPDFTLVNADGQNTKLSDLRGQAVLVNIWASWCPPCRAEMPAMQKMYEKYQADGFTILAVNAAIQDDHQAALDFVNQMQLTFPVLFDNNGEVTAVYDNPALPTSYFIDPQGIIQDVVVGGPMAEALLEIRVQQLLGKQSD